MPDPIQPLTPSEAATEQSQAAHEGYIHRNLVAIDQAANVALGGRPDETISSRAARADRSGKWWGRTLSRFLDLFQTDHGADAVAGDAERAESIDSTEHGSGILP